METQKSQIEFCKRTLRELQPRPKRATNNVEVQEEVFHILRQMFEDNYPADGEHAGKTVTAIYVGTCVEKFFATCFKFRFDDDDELKAISYKKLLKKRDKKARRDKVTLFCGEHI